MSLPLHFLSFKVSSLPPGIWAPRESKSVWSSLWPPMMVSSSFWVSDLSLETHFNLTSPMNHAHQPAHSLPCSTTTWEPPCSHLRAFALAVPPAPGVLFPQTHMTRSLPLPRSLLRCCLLSEASQTSYAKVQLHIPKPPSAGHVPPLTMYMFPYLPTVSASH